MEQFRLNYNPLPSDKTLRTFLRSGQRVRGIMGPVGSGKTSCCLMEFMRRAVMQKPSPIDGVRKTRWVAIRDTYRNLERTTIPTWLEWVPKEAGEWTGGSSGEPAKHTLKFPLKDGTRVHTEILFIAIGDSDVEDVYRGFPMTGIYVNEADLVSIDVVQVGLQRVGRYPAIREGGPTWRGVWCDFNAPNYEDPICDYFIDDPGPNVEFFEQPSGLSPNAENFANLPEGYYEQQMEGMEEWWCKRMVENKIGHSRDGKPVYPEYSRNLHLAQRPLEVLSRRPIIIGLDAGRTPAAGFQQRDSEGQLRIIDELVCEDMGAEAFGERLAEHIDEFYDGYDLIGYADPAAAEPTETSNKDDDAWIDIVANTAEIKVQPAPSQKQTDRKEALRQPMQKMITGDKPALIISPNCKMTIKGFAHGYKYKKVQGAKGLYHDKPAKNEFSHIIEANEYGALGITNFAALRGRRRRQGRRRRKAVTEWRAGGH